MLKVARRRQRAFGANLVRSAAVTEAGFSSPQPRIALKALALGLVGGVLLWAAFPPLNLPWLAWIAPVAWLWLARQARALHWGSYFALWVAGFAHWLLMLEGIRLAHPALYAGWITLAAYVGIYLPVFVGLTRVATQRLKMSLVAAAPLIWVGLELLRGHLITGFSMGLLAHAQAEFPRLIQISDLAGGYVLSLLIMFVAACVTEWLWRANDSRSVPHTQLFTGWRWIIVAAAAIGATLLYGQWRLSQTPPGARGPTARVALIQGSLDTVFDVSPQRIQETFDDYRRLTNQAVTKNSNLDLIAWPESMFAVSETLAEEPITAPPESGLSDEQLRQRLAAIREDFRVLMAGEARRANETTDGNHPGAKLLVGTTTYAYGSSSPRIYNSALLADRSGEIIGRYYKTHPVMFGEYIPLGEMWPWIYKLTPMAAGLSIGNGPTVFDVGGLKMSPSICFESTIPHLIRGQLRQLAQRGTPADCLINVTNDGWFWGTGMLDLHFRCGVFRAVENRKPLLVVANTGISTFVDGNGVIRQRGPRRQEQVLVAEVQADGRGCLYRGLGDLPAWICAAGCIGLAVIGLRKRQPPEVSARQ